MQKTSYEDYKYSMLDSNCLYIGAKYTLQEIVENEDILFKFRKVTGAHLMHGSDPEDTLETLIYYLEPGDFRLQVFKQMRSKVRVSIIEEKKSLFGKKKKEYRTKFLPVTDVVNMSVEDKEKVGLVIQELRVNKLALMTV